MCGVMVMGCEEKEQRRGLQKQLWVRSPFSQCFMRSFPETKTAVEEKEDGLNLIEVMWTVLKTQFHARKPTNLNERYQCC